MNSKRVHPTHILPFYQYCLINRVVDVRQLDADCDDILRCFHGKTWLCDVRGLSDLETTMEKPGSMRIHWSSIVNPAWMNEIRSRDDSRYRELTLKPPVNRVLSVSTISPDQLFGAYS